MDFNFSEEQLQLQDAITRFVQGDYDFEHHRKVVASADGWDRKAWQGLADLGVLAMIVPEDQGPRLRPHRDAAGAAGHRTGAAGRAAADQRRDRHGPRARLRAGAGAFGAAR